MADIKHLCKTCHWNQFRWCPDGQKIANIGNCDRWRPMKLSDAAKKKQKAIQKEAHERDVARIGKK